MKKIFFVLILSIGAANACETGASTDLLKTAEFSRDAVGVLTLGMVSMRGHECGKPFIQDRFTVEQLTSTIYNEVQFKPSPRCITDLVYEKFKCD